ncbi:5-formyltetrahydrofolate cyclo-ligase isoform X1 [Dipodomys spectabilis]|uniref:5-formyltetrahydrofolate cyclo-ligase isoform X1 n=1 Tax=Dipodomys spectabilis TaxID=105255 RepID=UPI001C537918|nr:5-formyltetrahydrofolate cyclo-ligase isoform X1 [Dipodomys spectabilis]
MAAAAVSGAKRSLRAELKQRLRALSAEERLRQSRLLTQKVVISCQVMAHSRYQRSQRVSIFLSMQDEVDTEEIIRDIFRQGKTCFIPRYQYQSNHMDMVRLASPEEIPLLPKTSWNIAQPAAGEAREEALSSGGLDLIFMPGLGFDEDGNRLGRGGGYYDAYIRRCLQGQGERPYLLALAFKEQLCPRIPVGDQDMRVDEVLYEDADTDDSSVP